MGALILIIIVLVAGIGVGLVFGFSRTSREATSKIQDTKWILIAKIAIGLGCAVLVGAVATAFQTWHFTRIARQASGTVIEMRQQVDRDSGSISYAPTFRFQDAAGVEHTVLSSFYTSPPGFHVGDRVTVLYRSDEPQTARIDTFWQVWGLPSLLGIIGSIELPISLSIFFWARGAGRISGETANVPTAS